MLSSGGLLPVLFFYFGRPLGGLFVTREPMVGGNGQEGKLHEVPEKQRQLAFSIAIRREDWQKLSPPRKYVNKADINSSNAGKPYGRTIRPRQTDQDGAHRRGRHRFQTDRAVVLCL